MSKKLIVVYESDDKSYIINLQNYMGIHPGEGIRNLFLRQFKNANITKKWNNSILQTRDSEY